MAFNLDDYEPVADRIERFWKDHPNGVICTDLIHYDDKHFIVKAYAKRDGAETQRLADATGYAEEIVGSTNVNRTSALENCETSAIGRALANLGYAVKNRASREEMQKVQTPPRPRSGGRKLTPNVLPTPPLPAPEAEVKAPQTNGSGEGLTVGQMRGELLASVKGDAAKGNMIWRETLAQFGFQPNDQVPDDMKSVIGEALKARVSA